MERKFFVCFIGAIVLLQVSFAIPIPDESKSSEEEGTLEKKVDDNLNLLRYALTEFGGVAKGTWSQGIDLLKDVVKDLKENEKKTASDDEEIEKITNYIEGAEKIKNSDGDTILSDLLLSFMNMSTLLDSYDDEKPDSSNKRILELIEKNGMKKISKDFDEKFAVFAEEFTKKIEDYIEKLSEERKAKETKLIEWFNKFKNEKDIDDKVLIFFDFVDLYDSSEEN